jgi:hypothetical protein
MAVSALAGGAVAGLGLRIPYLLSGLASLVASVIALRFAEPHNGDAAAPAPQMANVIRRTRAPVLGWTLLFSVSMVVFEHVPYEFFHPYVSILFAEHSSATYQSTPLFTGILMASMMIVAAVPRRYAVALGDRLGVGGLLLLALFTEVLLIAGMTSFLHALVLVLHAGTQRTLRHQPAGCERRDSCSAVERNQSDLFLDAKSCRPVGVQRDVVRCVLVGCGKRVSDIRRHEQHPWRICDPGFASCAATRDGRCPGQQER